MPQGLARAIGRFKQLASLGIGGEAVMPALLGALHEIIPSHAGNFIFADADGNPASHYNEHPDFPAALYNEYFYERGDGEIKGVAYSEAKDREFEVHDAEMTVGPDYVNILRRSDVHNLICRPMDYGNDFLRMFVRHPRSRKSLGLVSLFAGTGRRRWSLDEKNRFARLHGHFAYALTVRPDEPAALSDSGTSGLVITDHNGRLRHLTSEGKRLMTLATSPDNSPGRSVGVSSSLPAPLAGICRALMQSTAGRLDAGPPTYHHRNVWGGFRFQAQWLESEGVDNGLIAILISHQEPIAIRLTRGAYALPLTRRQAEVCVLVAGGASNEAVAERLGISRHTANEHRRWIYDRLGVHTRGELTTALLAS